MNPRSMCAIVLALALPALGQTEPQLEPLVPPSVQKNRKKSKKKPPPRKAPSDQAQALDAAPPAQGEGQLALPPLAPLTAPRPLTAVGVLVQGALPAETAARVAEGVRAAAKLAPGVRETLALEAPQPCADKACWVTAGVAGNVDHVLVAIYSERALRMKLVDVAARRVVQEAQRGDVSREPAEATAWAEALACKLMVPAGCTGEAMVQAGDGIALELDGKPLRSGEKRLLPVGVHALRIKDSGRESSRALPVLLEGAAPVSIAAGPVASAEAAAPVVPIAPLTPAAAPPPEAPVAALAASPPQAPSRTWTRTAGYAAAGAAVLAAGAGAYFGAKSRSDLNSAESAYRANGNAWQPADLDRLRSGNSAAHTANALFIASGILLAAGAALTFAF